jgi:hypothetical protein
MSQVDNIVESLESSAHENKDYGPQAMVDQLENIIDDSVSHSNEIFAKLDGILDIISSSENDEIKKKDAIEQIKTSVFDMMTVMQFQDMHQQKIERVINNLVVHLADDGVDVTTKKQHAPSAKHIDGDSDTDDLVDEDELEALIAQMGNK